jgi:hypothetical protein
MSTRCQIGFYSDSKVDYKKFWALFYKHSDGYPKGVIPTLAEILPRFADSRGNNPDYCAAWTLFHFMLESVAWTAQNSVKYSATLPADGYSFIGFGIDIGFHMDIEYFYRVDCDTRTVTIFETNFWGKRAKLTAIETIPFASLKDWKPVKQ